MRYRFNDFDFEVEAVEDGVVTVASNIRPCRDDGVISQVRVILELEGIDTDVVHQPFSARLNERYQNGLRTLTVEVSADDSAPFTPNAAVKQTLNMALEGQCSLAAAVSSLGRDCYLREQDEIDRIRDAV